MKQQRARIGISHCIALVIMGMTVSCATHRNIETPSAAQLLDQFKTSTYFVQQFEVAKKIVALNDPGVLPELEGWLSHEDRHIRANVAFIFASLGDDRGLRAIEAILTDRSYRPKGQGSDGVSHNVEYRFDWQIKADRYYAVHVLTELKDKRAFPSLVPLLKDEDVNYKVAWALGEIGDERAIPHLRSLLDYTERRPFRHEMTFWEAAETAIAKLEKQNPNR
ncbi:MAG: HEAT repeat domain-containing protein [Planctomycetota bacterium]|jgi:HEAT repeat protein